MFSHVAPGLLPILIDDLIANSTEKVSSRKRGIKIEMTGKRFGHMLVIREATDADIVLVSRDVQWICRCDCGKEKIVRGHNLRFGKTTSCGCSRSLKLKR